MKQIWNFICVQEFSHPLFNQITVDTTCCDVSRNHQKHHVGNKVNKPAKIQFRIHLWYWDLKDTIDTLSTWWMVTDWPLVYFVSQHLGIIWNCSFVQIYLTLCHYIHDVWQIFEALKHGKITNGGACTPGYEICTTMKQIMARRWSDNINIDNMLI